MSKKRALKYKAIGHFLLGMSVGIITGTMGLAYLESDTNSLTSKHITTTSGGTVLLNDEIIKQINSRLYMYTNNEYSLYAMTKPTDNACYPSLHKVSRKHARSETSKLDIKVMSVDAGQRNLTIGCIDGSQCIVRKESTTVTNRPMRRRSELVTGAPSQSMNLEVANLINQLASNCK